MAREWIGVTVSSDIPALRCKKERAHLNSLQRSLDTGCCRILRKKLSTLGAYLSESRDPDVQTEYARVLCEAEVAFRIEEVHGCGSLINLDHPVVKDLIGDPVRRDPSPISNEEIAAAMRYRSFKKSAHSAA